MAAEVGEHDLPRVVGLCRGLDGMALAIELAAARLPSLGLDGLEEGLADRLLLLTGGSRLDDRHRSLRSALDWSYALLDEPDRALLRRVSVFAGPFAARSAAEMLDGWEPIDADLVPTMLAGLADQSLLVTTSAQGGTRYRALETIRQYGAALVEDTEEVAEARARHLTWCLAAAQRLIPPVIDGPEGDAWRADFDVISVEARQALPRARYVAELRDPAYRLSLLLAELSFTRGRPGESQRRYELAAELAPDETTTAAALRLAAGAAEARQFGNEALRLRAPGGRGGAAGRRPDRRGHAARPRGGADPARPGASSPSCLPTARSNGSWSGRDPSPTGDPAAEARILTAEAFNLDERDPEAQRLVDRALELARSVDDRLGESAALDLLTSIHSAYGRLQEALDSAVRRTRLLAPIPITAESALEFFDAFQMAVAVRRRGGRPARSPTDSARPCATCRSTARRTTWRPRA